jgi:uncharacterized protein (DUF1015 family)
MAGIKPFRGVRYNPERFDDMRVVVSQPYDRIGDELQQKYYDLSPYNIVRIIQGKADGSDVYTRAKTYYEEWLKSGVFTREDRPALYAYEQTFTVGGKSYTRLGVIAAVELVDFSEGIILPHERTHSGPKEDRFRLLSTLGVNTEQIFILYPDAKNKVNALIRQGIGNREPDIDLVEIFESGVRQRVWVITDPAIIQAIEAEMAPKRNLIIADGHHRYETGLNYRNAQRAAHPDAPPTAAFHYVAATLVSMDDPGLVVLPTHREIMNFNRTTPAQILERAKEYFDVKPAANLDACLSAVNAHPSGHAFGFYGGKTVGFHVLTLKSDDTANRLIDDQHSLPWKSLSVSIVHKILLEKIAEVPTQGIEDKSMIRYHRDPQEPVDNVDRGEGNFVFFLSPTRMEQIKSIAGQGEKMPQKSTDFYPKVISGLTLLPVPPDEVL